MEETKWRSMKVSPENHRFLYLLCEHKDDTFDSAISTLINVAKPFLKRGNAT